MIGCFSGSSFSNLNTAWGGILRTSLRPSQTTIARFFVFVALVPRFGGGQRICVPLGHRPSMGQLPIPALWPGEEKVEERRGNSYNPVVAVVHLVGIIGTRWRALLLGGDRLGLASQGGHNLFVSGSGPGSKDFAPPDWPVMADQVDFSSSADLRRIPLYYDRCVQRGCDACRSLSWHR